ncbi:protein kintoun [Anopheles aquasalis]|uniref:protein kintoun n=1 Tax=Anopheles aquasalis TaxID=42839 RepID=UPI00215AF04A|nr:protein kintoun [Anopheles aquasalis]
MSTKGEFNLSRDEFRNITRCLENEEFRSLFIEYCDELRDPANRKRYEEELTVLEAERGYDVKFLNPTPGYVIKTVVDGTRKGFINVCRCDLVKKPSSVGGTNDEGQKGLRWSIPYAQSQPRKDYDNRNAECVVYDVMFHPDALHLASKNDGFRKLLNSTALDAVEGSFGVMLDRANLRFPKLQYKGTPKCTVMRERSAKDDATSERNEFVDKLLASMPPVPNANETTDCTKDKENIDKPVGRKAQSGADPFYTTPEYKIVQCRDVGYEEMTEELDAKIDVTIPRLLRVVITLPLLKSASDCALDVTKTALHLVSEKPARYKLELKLPYEVKENEGTAKFNVDEKTLSITLPVLRSRAITLQDINEVRGNAQSETKIVEPIEEEPPKKGQEQIIKPTSQLVTAATQPARKTVFPKFSVNKMENIFAFTLCVRNVDPATVELDNRTDSVYCRFTNVGNGFFPCYYVFFVRFPNAQVVEVQHEEWDNNLIIQITLNTATIGSYQAGPSEHETAEYSIMEDITDKINKFGKEIEDDSLCIAVVRQEKGKKKPMAGLSIEISKKNADEREDQRDEESCCEAAAQPEEEPACGTSVDEGDDKETDAQIMLKAKRNARKKNKKRSLSESFCDHLKVIVENESIGQSSDHPMAKGGTEGATNGASAPIEAPNSGSKPRKVRSVSECCQVEGSEACDESEPSLSFTRKLKGILKRSSFDRTISECSSVDDLGTSVELSFPGSIGEECRKTVRFNDAIRKQLFRSNSCILRQKKKSQKKREQKQRATVRRMSEGESTDNDEKDLIGHDGGHCLGDGGENEMVENDSGVSFDSESGEKDAVGEPETGGIPMKAGSKKAPKSRKNNQAKGGKPMATMDGKGSRNNKAGADVQNIEFKSDMIFDIEM